MSFQFTPFHRAIETAILTGKRNVQINAGPGSGKTTTGKMVVIPALIKSGLERGGAIAFNKKNATDLEQALAAYPGVECSTISAMALRRLKLFFGNLRVVTKTEAGPRRFGKVTKYCPATKGKLELLSETEAYGEAKAADLARAQKLVPLAKSAAIGLPGFPGVGDSLAWREIATRHNLQGESETEAAALETVISLAQSLFRDSVADTTRVDFEDFLYFVLFYGVALPQWQFLFHDESQDATPLVIEFLTRMASNGCRIVSVGDFRQAINLFTGAADNAMERLETALQAESFPLPVSYRCSHAAAELANGYFPDSVIAADGNAKGSVAHIESKDFNINDLSSGQALLSRTHKLLIPLALQAIKARQEFTYKGIAETVLRMNQALYFANMENGKSGSIPDIIRTLQNRQQGLEDKYEGNPPAWVTRAREVTECLTLVLAETMGEGGTLETVKGYLSTLSAAEHGKRGATLSTLHASKGLEWPVVYIIGSMQSPLAVTAAELQAEKCLAFVAVTRSSDKVIFVNQVETAPAE